MAPPRAAALRRPAVAAPLAVGALVLVSILVRVWLGRKIAAPWIMVDELVYSELAKSFADGGRFLIRDEPTALYSLVYPVLLSPAWLADSMTTTYTAAKAINAVVMSLAAVPVFLWARRLVTPPYAVLATALVLLMPAFLYTGTLMTENAFFPALVLAFFAMALALERPTYARQALVLGALALVCAVRLQALVLVLVYPTALALKLLLDRRAGEPPRLRPYWPTAATLAGAAVAYGALTAVRGGEATSALGAYRAAGEVGYSTGDAFRWVVYHLAELGISVAIAPVAALLVLGWLAWRGGAPAAERAFLAVAAAAVPWLVVEVGVFASRNSERIQERAMFGLAPLLLLAFAVWLQRGLPRPRLATAAGLALPLGLAAALPLGRVVNISTLSDAFALVPLLRLDAVLPGGLGPVRAVLLGGAALVGVAFALLPRRLGAGPLVTATGGFLVVTAFLVFGEIRDQSFRVRYAQGVGDDVSWVDDRFGRAANVAFLYTGELGAVPLWQVEFWNRSVGTVYNLGTTEPGSLPQTEARIDRRTGLLVEVAGGRPARAGGMVTDATVRFSGRLERSFPSGLQAYRTDGEPRVRALLEGFSPDGWTGPRFTYRRFGCTGSLVFTFESDRKLFRVPQRVRAYAGARLSGSIVIPPGTARDLTVERGCEITFFVTPTAVPAEVLPGSTDERELGLLLRRVRFVPG